uniref:DUF2490 domain-containing protein n=1 Tax=Flavobacterium sp. TaxID=239 RepID=UPI00404B8D37
MRKSKLYLVSICLTFYINSFAQTTETNDLGSWYMYFFNSKFKESPFGIQGDIQYRNWNIIGDTEQLLLRTGLTYTPKNTNILLTLGVANITSGAIGENDQTTNENRIYQELLLPQKIGNRIYLTHRFRYEQRFVENQDFRTRYRYNLFINVPINKTELAKNALYAAFYNEIFINGEKSIGNNRKVNYFDRNRLYLGLGYFINNKIRIQTGWMNQTTNDFKKGQLQISLHHTF